MHRVLNYLSRGLRFKTTTYFNPSSLVGEGEGVNAFRQFNNFGKEGVDKFFRWGA